MPTPSQARQVDDAARRIASFKSEWPDLYARVIAVERAHGVLYGALLRDRGKVKESDLYGLLTRRVKAGAPVASADPEADAGYALLGTRAAEVIRRTQAFHREVLSIFAGVAPSDRARALDEAVERYLSRPEVSLPDVPKDMTILYDHPYTSFVTDEAGPRRKQPYPNLSGFLWATHWFQLAALEPLELATDPDERRQGLTVVADRFGRKLSAGKPPDAFPTELPLAPCIAPGLVTIHLRAAAILDNLNMLHAVLTDVLVHPKVGNVRAALDGATAQFTDRTSRVVAVDDWIQMALRHSIFAQGGPALGTMTQSERNNNGHLQHAAGGRATMRGMP
ncbi:MAG: hypothetical protein Q7R30_11620 [Acidobacteriota bacterium]|nr:hypothetical protein [Acidobacteriota bacterium]